MSATQYLKSLVEEKPEHYVGHNPAGGWMVLALLFGLFVVTVSRLKVYAIEEGLGPLAGVPPTVAIISFAQNLILLFVFLHIGGVIISSRMYNEHLVKAMFTGKKPA